MTLVEYQSWQEFYADEPFGDVRADLRSGIVAALIARTMGGKRNAKPLDFMPIVRTRREADAASQSQAQRNAAMRSTFEGNLGTMRLRRSKITRG